MRYITFVVLWAVCFGCLSLKNFFSGSRLPGSFQEKYVIRSEESKSLPPILEGYHIDHFESFILTDKKMKENIHLKVASFKNIYTAMGFFLEIRGLDSKPLRIKQNQWAFLNDTGFVSGIWQDQKVYWVKSRSRKDKNFWIDFFRSITKEHPAQRRRPHHFKLFLQLEVDLKELAFAQKKEVPFTKGIYQYFYLPWRSKDRQEKIYLSIKIFPDSRDAHRDFNYILATVKGSILTKWNAKSILNNGKKIVSYPVIFSSDGGQKQYYTVHQDVIILLSGGISERLARNIFQKTKASLD